MDRPTPHPIHPALYRPLLLAGAEQGIAIFEGTLIAGLLVVVGPHLATLALVAFYLGVFHPLAVWAAARDPLFSGVYLRSLTYAGHYPAVALWNGRRLPVRPSVRTA